MYMVERLLASKLLGNCGVFLYHLADYIEAFHVYFSTKMYEDSAPLIVKVECWTVVLTMVKVVCQELREVCV